MVRGISREGGREKVTQAYVLVVLGKGGNFGGGGGISMGRLDF